MYIYTLYYYIIIYIIIYIIYIPISSGCTEIEVDITIAPQQQHSHNGSPRWRSRVSEVAVPHERTDDNLQVGSRVKMGVSTYDFFRPHWLFKDN